MSLFYSHCVFLQCILTIEIKLQSSADVSQQLLKTGGLLTSYIVARKTSCVCVPPGSCSQSAPQTPNDGSGRIDVRIVANVRKHFVYKTAI